jgi:hypothetical protein
MAAYTLSRLFFFITSPDLFPDVTAAHLWEMLLGGMRFDLTAILYLSSVYLLLALRIVLAAVLYVGVMKLLRVKIMDECIKFLSKKMNK